MGGGVSTELKHLCNEDELLGSFCESFNNTSCDSLFFSNINNIANKRIKDVVENSQLSIEEVLNIAKGSDATESLLVTVESESCDVTVDSIAEAKESYCGRDIDKIPVGLEIVGCVDDIEPLKCVLPVTDNNIISLNFSGNILSDECAKDEKGNILRDSHLIILTFGGFSNGLCETSSFPRSLLVLDLSFGGSGGGQDSDEESEGDGEKAPAAVVFPPGCFLHCCQLLRLVLDGCGISTTVVPASDKTFGTALTSVFAGLVSLQELSLKENRLKSLASLDGLGWASSRSSSGEKQLVPCGSQLKCLWLADNEVVDVCAKQDRATKANALVDHLLTVCQLCCLETVDGRPSYRGPASASRYEISSTSTAQAAAAQKKKEKESGYDFADGGLAISNDQEKEFTNAITGVKDYTVVS